MNELNNHFENGSKLPDKFICFTLDDGYKDSLTHGLPIFKKHQVPFTIYITNCFPNGTAVLWWYLFESHAKSYNELIINSSLGKMKFNWQNQTEAFEQFRQVSEAIKSIPATELNFVLSKSFKVSTADLKKQCKNIALSWNDIIQLSKEPLVTIGAHTMNHISVKQQSASIVEKEMKASKLEIEQYIGMEVIHFAYPFGSAFDVSKRDIDIAFDAGYKTSTLNQPGNIFRCNKQSRNALARMPLGNQTDSYRMENYMNGIYHYSVNGFKRNIY
ncbi:MAG: polysaccharide deacetylase family protein [Crocinitomicaceae bacterium]